MRCPEEANPRESRLAVNRGGGEVEGVLMGKDFFWGMIKCPRIRQELHNFQIY